jgi:hypothetical protein
LEQIFDGVFARFRVMESERLSDRMIDQRGILLNERVPGRFVASNAAGKEGFFFFGHATR